MTIAVVATTEATTMLMIIKKIIFFLEFNFSWSYVGSYYT